MAESFNPQLFFRRCDKEIFREFIETQKIGWQIDWEAKPKRFLESLFVSFATDPKRSDLETVFCEIHETAQDAGTVKQLLRVAEEEKLDIPEKLLTMSTYDLALWLYIHTEEKVWDRIVRFIYADRWSDSMWLVSNLEDAPNDPDWKRPEISVLEKAISSHIVSHELRGQHVEIIHEQRDDNNEYFFVYFNDYRTSKSIYTDEGAFNHNAINRDAKIMLFWIQHDQRRINARIEKMDSRRKKELCDLVTKTMLNCHIQGRKKRLDTYDLSQFLNPIQGGLFQDLDGALTVGDDGEILSARVIEIGVKIPGTHAAFRVQDEQGKIYELLRNKLSSTDIFKAGQEVDYVAIKLYLDESYKRSRNQTLRLTPNSKGHTSSNGRVNELIEKTLKRWKIDQRD